MPCCRLDDIEVVFYEEGGIVKQEGGLLCLCNLVSVKLYLCLHVCLSTLLFRFEALGGVGLIWSTGRTPPGEGLQ